LFEIMRRFGFGTWIIAAFLAVLVVLAAAFLYVGWTPQQGEQGTPMSLNGYIAMTIGIVVTIGLGVGLMALVFYSNKHDRD
jgi:hypothetical protein